MKKLALFAACGTMLAQGALAQNATTVPVGVMTISMTAGRTTMISVPMMGEDVYSGIVGSLGASTISVSGAPWTAGEFAGTRPYFVQIKSGLHAGRSLRIVANTTSSITVDTDDNVGLNVPLTVAGRSVAAGDRIQIFTGDTLGSLFGESVSEIAPLVGAARLTSADTVSIYDPITGRATTFFFNTTSGYWVRSGSTANQNNVIIAPGQGIGVLTLASGGAKSLTVIGTVPDVPPTIKIEPKRVERYGTTFPVDITLGQLDFGSNWVKNNRLTSADTISVWQPVLNRYLTYFKKTDNLWYLSGVAAPQTSTVIPAGTALNIQTVTANLTGSQVLYSIPLPYNL